MLICSCVETHRSCLAQKDEQSLQPMDLAEGQPSLWTRTGHLSPRIPSLILWAVESTSRTLATSAACSANGRACASVVSSSSLSSSSPTSTSTKLGLFPSCDAHRLAQLAYPLQEPEIQLPSWTINSSLPLLQRHPLPTVVARSVDLEQHRLLCTP